MNSEKYKIISEINITSLVDVTMVLLIIFMITAPLMQSRIEVELPKSKVSQQNAFSGVIVTLTRNGDIKLNDKVVRLENFERTMLELYAASSQKMVLLQADKEVKYGGVITLMDRIKSFGIDRIGLIVDPDKEK